MIKLGRIFSIEYSTPDGKRWVKIGKGFLRPPRLLKVSESLRLAAIINTYFNRS